MGWQGVIRYLAPDYDRVIIIGQTGHDYLYKDFCTDYIEYNDGGVNPNMWANDNMSYPNPLRNRGDVWIKPQQMTLMHNPPMQDFIKYGEKNTKDTFDIICHSRNITKYDSGFINFPVEKWKELFDGLSGNYRIASIGTRNGADHIPETVDLRGIHIGDLTNVLASSRVLIGPSSGPVHLGSLCGIPAIVWSGYEKSKLRYESEWNPLNSPVKVISADGDPWGNKEEWQPDTNEIIESLERML